MLFSSFFVVTALGGVGTLRVMACPTPIPLAAITQEYVHPQCLLNLELKLLSPGRFHL